MEKCEFLMPTPHQETHVKKSRFTEGQIIAAIKESEAGAKTPDICRKLGISSATFYKWKSKFGGMEVSDVAKMRALETKIVD